MKPILSPEDVRKAQDAEVLQEAHALAVRITEELKDAPGLEPGATQYAHLDTKPPEVPSREVMTQAADLLGHAGWLDVRVELGKTAPPVILVSVTVPEPELKPKEESQ